MIDSCTRGRAGRRPRGSRSSRHSGRARRPRPDRDRGLAAALGALGALLLTVATVLTAAPSAHGAASGPARAAAAAADAAAAVSAFTLPALDLHDGMVAEFGGTYYAYGTEYGCGYRWDVSTPWCGFGVAAAASPTGPWTQVRTIVHPGQIDPASGRTFDWVCGENGGHGCFNPRMVQRADGVFVLWFNAVADRVSRTTNAYVVMGCNGPAGGCGAEAGPPHGSTHKPVLHQCNGRNGDFALAQDADGGAVICDYGGVLAEERLDGWWANGTGRGATALGGLTSVEAPGVYQDPGSGKWIMTYSDPNCGYCSGTPTGYATAPSLVGPWSWPRPAGFSAPVSGRRDISATSCGGQPRTVSILNGQAYQGIDLWTGSRNQTDAGVRYEPLDFLNPTGAPGVAWQPFTPFSCAPPTVAPAHWPLSWTPGGVAEKAAAAAGRGLRGGVGTGRARGVSGPR